MQADRSPVCQLLVRRCRPPTAVTPERWQRQLPLVFNPREWNGSQRIHPFTFLSC